MKQGHGLGCTSLHFLCSLFFFGFSSCLLINCLVLSLDLRYPVFLRSQRLSIALFRLGVFSRFVCIYSFAHFLVFLRPQHYPSRCSVTLCSLASSVCSWCFFLDISRSQRTHQRSTCSHAVASAAPASCQPGPARSDCSGATDPCSSRTTERGDTQRDSST